MKKCSLKDLMKKRKKKGFTLVELIIVIAIIAILVAIAIPKFGEVTKNANKKADIATAKNIHSLAAAIVAEKGISDGLKTTIDGEVAAKLDGASSTTVKDAGGDTTKDVTTYELPNTKLDTKKKFDIDIGNDGNITIFAEATGGAGKVQVYPDSSNY